MASQTTATVSTAWSPRRSEPCETLPFGTPQVRFFFFSLFFLALCTSYSLWYLTATPSSARRGEWHIITITTMVY